MRNVALIGNAGSGKTTVAKYLQEKYDYQPISLAMGVKHIASAIFNADITKKTPKNRRLMQQIGSKMREIDPKVWISTTDSFMRDFGNFADPPKFVIDDVRFLNEAEHYKKKGWVLVFLNCPRDICKERIAIRDGAAFDEMFEHESETQVGKIAEVLYDVIYEVDAGSDLVNVLADIDDIVGEIENF